ncbi:hypothetical protein BN946_scf184791.g29 [Trametes cinnabarina]|uniref:Uncharacterized protein n=1 Tax=Pycnoporus cinnabarinus TaxID=5643 RepID=A0A060SAX7_PYCCI|nr:hypothetical protein BN946_scf184791.g29 [Trametes cinnabarina]
MISSMSPLSYLPKRVGGLLGGTLSLLYTLFLFTKSDIKTTVIPVSFLAFASAPLRDASRISHVVFWVWFHVLQFDVSNQTLDPDEDAKNKSDRPLPAKRISLRNAILLRWLLVPACWLLSSLYSPQTVYASIALVALTIIYDELGAHGRHWIIRNLVNALGFASFEVGATLVAGNDPGRLDSVALLSVIASTGIFATTIHTQDFKDIEGDSAIGRQTIPIVFGKFAKYTVIIPMTLWSIGLSYMWHLDALASLAFVLLGLFVGVKYLVGRTIPEYQVAFYWYNAWLTCAHVLPAYYRLYGRNYAAI